MYKFVPLIWELRILLVATEPTEAFALSQTTRARLVAIVLESEWVA